MGDYREFTCFSRAMTTHVNRGIKPSVNGVKSTMTHRLRDFGRMNCSIFIITKVGVDPQYFLDGVYKVLSDMGCLLGRRRSYLRTN